MTPLGVGSQARQAMTMRVEVSRPDDTASDEFGGESRDASPSVIYAELACRAWVPTDEREVMDESKDGVFGAVRFAMPADADISDQDILGDVVDRLGRVIFPGPMRVTGVWRRASHLSVMARVQRGDRIASI